MTYSSNENLTRRGHRWSPWLWGGAALLWMLPLVAMRFSPEMTWDAFDFAVFGVMLVTACGLYELAARLEGRMSYRAAVAVALAGAFLLVWINLAVGIIETEDNPANLMYAAVLFVGVAGGIITRFKPAGMACVMVAMAVAQGMVGVTALMAGHFTLVIEAVFATVWLVSAWLFRKAARAQSPA